MKWSVVFFLQGSLSVCVDVLGWEGAERHMAYSLVAGSHMGTLSYALTQTNVRGEVTAGRRGFL